MVKEFNKKIILEDGQEYYGYGFGAHNEKVCEIVFNTSMVGYQEILSDPSYTYQAVVMTYPLIGNYGMADVFSGMEFSRGIRRDSSGITTAVSLLLRRASSLYPILSSIGATCLTCP